MKLARLLMRHRAQVYRNAETGTDRFNNPLPPDYQPHASPIPCRLWSSTERTVEGPAVNVVVEDLRLLVPLGADVTTADRIGTVTNRRGDSIDPRTFRIDADQIVPDSHRELVLSVVAGV